MALTGAAFTVCRSVVHQKGDQPSIEVTHTDGRSERIEGLTLNRALSQSIFRRTHDVAQLTVTA